MDIEKTKLKERANNNDKHYTDKRAGDIVKTNRESEPVRLRKPIKTSEPCGVRKPNTASEPPKTRKPFLISEPTRQRKPQNMSDTLKKEETMKYLKYLFTDWIICHNHIPSFIRRRKARKLRDAEIASIEKERTEKLRETEQLGFSFFAGIVNEIYNYKILSIVLQPLPSYKSDAIDAMIKESKNVKVQSPEVLQ